MGRSGAEGASGNPETGAAVRGPTGGWIGAPRPSMGGRSGIARGLLSSAGVASFVAGFCSPGEAAVGCASASVTPAGGVAEAPAALRFSESAGRGS